MVPVTLFRGQWQSRFAFSAKSLRFCIVLCWTLLASLIMSGCRVGTEEIYRGTTSDRMIELRSGTAYITEGTSTQAVHYQVEGDRLILNLPFMNSALRRMPDGSLSGMGERLVKIDSSTAALLGTYESAGGEYRLKLGAQGHAIYSRGGRSSIAIYTFAGDQITLKQGSLSIPVKRRPDGSLETPDAVLRKQN